MNRFKRPVNRRKPVSRYDWRRDPVVGMVQLWSAFLSCDARDMCRAGPALVRNLLAWLAFALRLITLWIVMSPAFCTRVASDVYWVTRQNHPDYLAFKVLRDEVDQTHEAWARGELSDGDARNSALTLADRLRRWREQTDHEIDLFSEEFSALTQECPPFHAYNGGLALLDSHEKAGDGFFICDYFVFVF